MYITVLVGGDKAIGAPGAEHVGWQVKLVGRQEETVQLEVIPQPGEARIADFQVTM